MAVRLHRDLAEWAQANGARELGRIWRALLKRDAERGAEQEENGELSYEERINATIESVVATFNERYLVVNEAGKAVIYQPGIDPILRRRRFDRLSFQDLRALYLNDQIEIGISKNTGEPEFKSVATVWLGHPKPAAVHPRRRVQSYPQGITRRLSQSLGRLCRRAEAWNWSLFRSHLSRVICNGREDHYEYLLRAGWPACSSAPSSRARLPW